MASTNSASRPSATNRPTQISSVRELCMVLRSLTEHQCRENEVQPQHGKRGMDDGAGGGAADAFGRRRGIEALEQRDPGGDEAEYDALEDAIVHIGAEAHVGLHLRPVG